MTTLLMSSRHTEDNQLLWRAATRRGWAVARARGVRLPALDDDETVIYVESLYAPTIASALGLELLGPREDWLVRLPDEFKHRRIELTTLGSAWAIKQAVFVKPPNDKSFAAAVYESGACLPAEFDPDTNVLVSEPVRWLAEFRCFCLEGKVKTLSPYLRSDVHAKLSGYEMSRNESQAATAFAEEVLAAMSSLTPRAVALDVGLVDRRGWAVVEANGAWGAGIYGCDPDATLDVVQHATVKPN